MTTTSNQILIDFQNESEKLVAELLEILESCEGNFSQVLRLEKYGQIVDRIMGGAKSLLPQAAAQTETFQKIADVSALCKAVGYKSSQIKTDEDFFNACVAVLFDATEVLKELLIGITTASKPKVLSTALIERLRWISGKFGAEFKDSIDVHGGKSQKMSQGDIDELMKKMGL